MKTKLIGSIIVIMVVIGFLVSCDMINDFMLSRTRPLTLIQTYNSNLENTSRMVPNETLYVKVQGLKPNESYTVQCLDPSGDVITEIITDSDDEGVIGTSPLWYNVGFIKDKDTDTGRPVLDDNLLRTFNIRVVSNDYKGTDFKLPFFFINVQEFERPKPVLMSGTNISVDGDDTFFLENAFYSAEAPDKDSETDEVFHKEVFVKAINIDADVDSSYGYEEARVWILPFLGDNYQDGSVLSNRAWFFHDVKIADLVSDEGFKITWPNTAANLIQNDETPNEWNERIVEDTDFVDEIPDFAESNAFIVFLDMNKNGTYEVLKEGTKDHYLDSLDGNGVAGFIVRKNPEEIELPAADYISINLASGGDYSWTFSDNRWMVDNDYRNEFRSDGVGTVYSSRSGEFWGYGVKVNWNPYQVPYGWNSTGRDMPSEFWGNTVDVYIVNSTQPLHDGAEITDLAPGTSMRRVPVQYGCGNGWWQQTIWRASISEPMTPGNYMVIVDMDGDGVITDNTLVDDLGEDGLQRIIDDNPAGFSVIP